MKRNFILILVIFLHSNCFAQHLLKCKLLDSVSKEPVQYANISIIHSPKGTYSNIKGCFELEFDCNSDSLFISMVGYKSLIVKIESLNLLQEDTLFLVKNTYELNEVTIFANTKLKSDTKNLGYINKASNISISGRSRSEIAVYINNTEYKSAFIKEVVYEIKRHHISPKNKQKELIKDKRFENFKTAVRVHLYTKDSVDGKPDKELLVENVVIILDEKFKDKLKVDISKHNIILPKEGVFVGIEWLGLVDEITSNIVVDKKYHLNTSVLLTTKLHEKITWMRHAAYGQDWGKKDMEALQKLHKNNEILNAAFGISIEVVD